MNVLFIGCFADGTQSDLDTLIMTSTVMTRQYCVTLCLKKGFLYAGLQTGYYSYYIEWLCLYIYIKYNLYLKYLIDKNVSVGIHMENMALHLLVLQSVQEIVHLFVVVLVPILYMELQGTLLDWTFFVTKIIHLKFHNCVPDRTFFGNFT